MNDKKKTLVYKESMLEKLSHFHPDYMFNITSIKNFIKEEPEAEQKKGHWIGIDDEPCETFECDVCGFTLEDWIQGAFYNYCPNCGADMREPEWTIL